MASRTAPSRALTGPFPSAVATIRSSPTTTFTVASVDWPSPWSAMTR